jgi:hypothetical protein
MKASKYPDRCDFPDQERGAAGSTALHRVRDRWIGRRTAVINQLRGFLLEHGISITAGPAHRKPQKRRHGSPQTDSV